MHWEGGANHWSATDEDNDNSDVADDGGDDAGESTVTTPLTTANALGGGGQSLVGDRRRQ